MRTAQWLSRQDLTEVGDHDGHLLVDRVEDHDDDEANNGSRDGRGHLWGQVLLDWVCPIGVLGERRGEHDEHGQPVDNDPDHRGDDEQDLKPPRRHRVSFSRSPSELHRGWPRAQVRKGWVPRVGNLR